MNKVNTHKIFLFCLSWLLAGLVSAQNKISVKASVDKNKILIGERMNLTLEADFTSDKSIQFFSVDSLQHFLIVSKGKIDTSKTSTGISLKQVFQLTSFDSGHWVIPPFILNRRIKTDPVPVDVVFSNFDPSKDYHDIKDIIEVNPMEKKTWWKYLLIASVIVIAVIAWLLVKRKKPEKELSVKQIDPYQEAMQHLKQIQKETGSLKQYYSSLVDVFRLYVFRKKGIHSLQKTTDDLVIQLKQLGLERKRFDELAQVLRLSDSVKFAKYIPSDEDNKMTFEIIKNAIEIIERSNA